MPLFGSKLKNLDESTQGTGEEVGRAGGVPDTARAADDKVRRTGGEGRKV